MSCRVLFALLEVGKGNTSADWCLLPSTWLSLSSHWSDVDLYLDWSCYCWWYRDHFSSLFRLWHGTAHTRVSLCQAGEEPHTYIRHNVLAKLTWPRQQFVPDTVSCTYFQELLCCLSWVEWRAPSQVETQTNGLIFQTNLKVTQEALSQSNEYERLWDTVKTRATSQGTSNVELSFCTIQVLGSSLTVRLQLRQVDYFIIWIWLSVGVTGPRTPEGTLLSWQGCHVFQFSFLILLR